VHGGPFANIAYGCNSALATRTALKLADYVVTEAGFGADLGAEKFIDIKCRKTGLRPNGVVLVATVRALKYQGGTNLPDLNKEDLESLKRGMVNIDRHVANIRNHYGMPVVVAMNRFGTDTDKELALVKAHMAEQGIEAVVCEHFAKGGEGAVDLAKAVVKLADRPRPELKFVYEDADTLWHKIGKIAEKIYGASEIIADTPVRKKIEKYQQDGFGHFPVCIAKTQYSFSTDPQYRGAATGHVFKVRDVYLSAGAEFLVALCGDIMTMPGLPRKPASEGIDVNEKGEIVGLS
jgi:formate--tetrahydrofolate ligase